MTTKKVIRKNISPSVRDAVLRESGYICGNPNCRHILTLELNHIEWVKEGGGNNESNLIALCANCHELHTRGHIPKEAIRHWKGMLVALNHAFSKESMDLLLFLYHKKFTIWYSGDGVLKFAGLIAAGLVTFGEQAASNMISGSNTPSSSHQVKLTEAGTVMVEAWLSGDETKYLESLKLKSRDIKS